jgi:2-hydroxychromene-2-carboxylate isomerase
MPLQFWFEFASPYSYPAAMRIEAIAQVRHVDIEWNAFLLGPIFKAQGWDDSPFNIYPAKGRYMWRDLERICGALALPFRRSSLFPRNGALAARIVTRFNGAVWIPRFVIAVYQSNFVEDQDFGEAAVIADCLEQVWIECEPIISMATDVRSKTLFRAQIKRAMEQNIFGAPSFVSNGELFWGNDRLEQAVLWHAVHGEIC